jgi:hypothetical protein
MGIGNSRKRYVNRPDKPSLSTTESSPGGGKPRKAFFQQRKSIPIVEAAPPIMVHSIPNRAMYGSYAAMAPMPIYAPAQPMSSPFLSMRYNNFAASPYMAPRSMMMPSQRMAPPMQTPFLALPAPSMSTPYVNRTHFQHHYNHMVAPRTNNHMAIPRMINHMAVPRTINYMAVPRTMTRMPVPRTMPAIMTGAGGVFPPPYPSVPTRLLTDWTGGGKISPGFLGPPI